jgi:hypothetical protein
MAIGTLSPEAVRKGRVPTVRTRPYAARTRKAARKRVLAFLLLVTLTALAAGLVSGVWLIYFLSQKLPGVENLAALRLNPITTVVSRDGVLLATLETQPIQQKVNGAHGITSHPVAAPTLEELQMAYLAEQKRREALAKAQQGAEGQNTPGELTATGRVGGPFPLAAPTEASDEYESERQNDTAESQSLPSEQISSR